MKKLLFLVAAIFGVLTANAATGDNLWTDASVTQQSWKYFDQNWTQQADPQVTAANGSYSFSLPTATVAQWQAQYGLITNISATSANKYSFSCKITSSAEINNVTVKLFKTGADGELFFEDHIHLTAGQAYDFTKNNFDGRDFDSVELLFDFGGNPANTNITISDIKLIDNGSAPAAVAPTTAAPDPTVDASKVFSIYSDKYGNANGLGFDPWGSSTQGSEIQINGNNVRQFKALNYYGIIFGQTDVTNYNVLHLDIYANEDASIGIVPIWWNTAENKNFLEIRYTANVKGGQWTSIDIPATAFASDDRNGTNLNYQLKLDNGNNKDFWVDNIYWYTTGEVPEIPFAINAADDRGFTHISGTIKEENLADIKALNVTALDISGATLAEGITKIETANPNTIIAVKGTQDGDHNVTSAQADQLTDTKNLVLRDDYIFPVKQLEFQDGYDFYSNFFISTNTKGYKYTRTIGAKKYVTTMVPAIVDAETLSNNYPALSIYRFDADNSNSEEIKFNKYPVLTPAEPYVIHNSSDADVTLTVVGSGDFNLTVNPASAVQGTTAQFVGTYKPVEPNGTQYGLQNSIGEAPEFRSITAGATIPAFRAYFLGNVASAKAVFSDGSATGINTIKAADIEDLNAPAYNIAGQRVNKDTKGIVIINGKKYINK